MKNIILILFTLIISCSTGPQPLMVGKDECFYCKMPVAEKKFGAEIITEKGKCYKFDDVGCMINFMKYNFSTNEKAKNILTVNYADHQQFLNVNDCVFLKSVVLHSPMNSGIAAFESTNEVQRFLREFPGSVLSWNQLQAN